MKKILIKAIDPLIVDYRSAVSNEHETLDYIPASRLRGAFFEFRERLCPGVDIEALLGYCGPRWTHAWPSDSEGNHWHIMPKCPNYDPSEQRPGESKPKGPGANWFREVSGGFFACGVKEETNMSVGRHYGRQANREGALYARKAISPGQHFVAYVDYRQDLPTGTFNVNIGTRRSANGLCMISISESQIDFSTLDSTPDYNFRQVPNYNFRQVPNSAAIQLLSDAIIPAPGGGYLRGLGKADFERIGGFPVESVVSAYSASKTVSGWAGKWGLPRESALAIEAGSVWLVTVEANYLEKLHEFTGKLLANGLGIRAYEGFGTVAVNPSWLSFDGRSLNCTWTPEIDAGAKKNVHPPSWPESTDLNLEQLSKLIKSGRESAKKLKSTPKAQDARQWLTWVARNGASDHQNLPGLADFEIVKAELTIDSAHLQSAQLFFLTVVESELIEAEQATKAAADADSPSKGGEE